MTKVLTADDLRNNKFVQPTPRGDKHRQEAVFDKGNIAFGLPRRSRTNPDTPNNLSRYRWRGPILDQRTERDLIRKAKSDDQKAKRKLVEVFHRKLLKIVGEYSGPPHADMLSAALFGFWLAVSRFNENRGYRLWTYAEDWIRKYIRLCIKDRRREGAAGETRQDRFIFSNGAATAEQVVAAVGGTISNAEKAIARHNTQHGNYSEGANDHSKVNTADDRRGPQHTKPAASHDMRRMYDCFKAHQLSPQLRGFNAASKWIDSLARKAGTGRKYHSINLYRTATEIGERAKIAARMSSVPVFAETGDKPVVAAKLQQYELDARAAREKTARLKALRLANPKPQPERKRKKAKWRDTPTTTPAKSLPSPSRPVLQLRCGSFAKKNLSHSATFVELHCSAA
jgi:hypothetical protein